jgi:WD40-like Beta Propeller Repeat
MVRTTCALACVAALSLWHAPASAAATNVAGAPRIFAPGRISGPGGDGAPSFLPDGHTLYFTRSGPNGTLSVILESTLVGKQWSDPKIASFSGTWYDSSPAVAPTGRYLVFQSSRPSGAADTSSSQPTKRISHLWRVDAKKGGWSTPQELPEAVNISGQMYRPSIAGNGNLYFISRESAKQKFRLYRTVLLNGTYQPAQALPFSDGSTLDVDAEIAPDESFLIFASAGREPFHDDHEHLYIVFRKGDDWGAVEPLRFEGDNWPGSTTDDDPRLSRDGRVLYFSSDRTPPIHYPMDATAVQQALSRVTVWDTGNTNVWELDFSPEMFLPRS